MTANPNFNSHAYNKPNNPFEKGQCTWFAFGRALELTGTSIGFSQNYNRHGKNWINLSVGLTTGLTPLPHSVAVWAGDKDNPYGHVGYVEDVVSDMCSFRETNITSFGKNLLTHYDEANKVKNYTTSAMSIRGKGVGRIIGYIYLNPLSAIDFWRKQDPLYASASADIANPNFDAQFKIKNTGSAIVTIEAAAIAVQDAFGGHLFDMVFRGPPIANRLLPPGESLPTGLCVGYFRNAGDYRVAAKVKIAGCWHTLGLLPFAVKPAAAGAAKPPAPPQPNKKK